MTFETLKATIDVGKVAASETTKNIVDAKVDIGKRIEVKEKSLNNQTLKVDVFKRIKLDGKFELSEVAKELTAKQKQELLDRHMSPGIVDDCTIKNGKIQLKTYNEKLVNSIQPDSKVGYVKKTLDLNGIKVEGVFPKFEAVYTTQLPEEKLISSDRTQFKECNLQLKMAIENNPTLKSKFTNRQLQQINLGYTPGGYTWHHNEKIGKMELVDSIKHDSARHTGGRAIWGGGTDCR